MSESQFICVDCHMVFPEETRMICCTCGGLLIMQSMKNTFHDNWIDKENQTMWKFHRALSVQTNLKKWEKVSMGEGNTDLDKLDSDNQHIYLKLEDTLPCKSYMDRSSALLVTKLIENNIKKIIFTEATYQDLSIAKYAQQANIPCELGLDILSSRELVDAFRNENVRINDSEYDQHSMMKNHVFFLPALHPYLIEGAKTYAFEIWMQLGNREPDIMTFSIESSLLAVGAYYGFRDLFEHHLIKKIPRFIIVDTCSSTASTINSKEKPAQMHPSLYKEIENVIRQTDGHMQIIANTEIVQAGKALLMRGYHTDEPSAAAYAGCMRYYRDYSIKTESIVIPISNFHI